MNILIWSGRYGMGHLAVAAAIKEQILHSYPQANVSVVDTTEVCFPLLSREIYGSFNFVVKHKPEFFNTLTRLDTKVSHLPLKREIIKKIDALLQDLQPDLIICALPLSCQYMAAYRASKNCNIPLFTFVTDLDVHPDWITAGTDLYFVGAKSSARQLRKAGVNRNQIIISGIPVRQAFYQQSAAPKKPDDLTEVLVMGGGLGLIPAADALFDQLAQTPRTHVTVITGHNSKLYDALQKQYPQFKILGFEKHPENYLRAADLLLTKAGGITVAEAIHTNTPMFIFPPFLQHEQQNAQYVQSHNLGVVGEPEQQSSQLDFLLTHPQALKKIKQNISSVLSEYSEFALLDQIAEYTTEAPYNDDTDEETA